MLVVALVLLAIGLASVAIGLFWSDTTTGNDALMGIHLGPTPIFIWGMIATVCLFFGLKLLKYGAVQEIRHRKEQRKMRGMADQISAYETERKDRERPREDG